MKNRKGFTLIELCVAMAIASFVMAAIYSVYRAQTESHRNQQLVVEMQQNMRAAMYLLEREIRMAGYSAALPRADAGFVENFVSLDAPHNGSGAATDAANVAFTVDDDSNGAIAPGSGEAIAFRYNAGDETLERWGWDDLAGAWDWYAIAEQITNFSITYHKQDDSVIAFPITTADMTEIYSVEVNIEASSGDRTMNLTNKIKCRNMGF